MEWVSALNGTRILLDAHFVDTVPVSAAIAEEAAWLRAAQLAGPAIPNILVLEHLIGVP